MRDFIEVDGIHIYFERVGHGNPLLMIPGLGAGTWLWSKSMHALSKHFELIMPELRGSGRSDKPDHRYSVALFANDLKILLDYLEITRIHVLGASMGGFVAQHFAATWIEQVMSLVLVSTSLGGENQIGPSGDVLSRTIRPHGRTRRERLEDAYTLNFTQEYMSKHRNALNLITEWRVQNPQPEFAYYRQLLAGNAFDGSKLARKITAPTLICAGKEDPLVPMEDVHMLKNMIPHAELKIFEGKHLFFYEQNGSFNKAIMDFLGNVKTSGEQSKRPALESS